MYLDSKIDSTTLQNHALINNTTNVGKCKSNNFKILYTQEKIQTKINGL